MAERHRAEIEFVEWNRGYLPGFKGFRKNPPEPVRGVWLKRRVRGRAVHYEVALNDFMTDAEAAAVMGITRQTIRNWRLSGKLKARRKRGQWLYECGMIYELYRERGGEKSKFFFVN